MTWGTEYGPIDKEFVIEQSVVRVGSKSFSHRVVGQWKTVNVTPIVEMSYLWSDCGNSCIRVRIRLMERRWNQGLPGSFAMMNRSLGCTISSNFVPKTASSSIYMPP